MLDARVGTQGSSGGKTTATTGATRSLQRRRIIERPRLFALLDGSAARVRTLVAPAGYGKTTLAEQWVARDGRRGAWFTARRSSTDVAALALGLARASTKLVPDCDARLREHLRAAPAPGEHTDVLAEILGEDLADWPSDGWLVFDEYQEITRSGDAERFVEELIAASPAQFLVASRERPSWVSARGILYGDFLELNQTDLAMDGAEAAEVLAGRSASSASGLVALANGWPAVIGLASVSTAEVEGEDQVPESLYRFFAEELYDALGDDVRAGLATLVIAPVLDRELADVLLGAEAAESVCAAALDVGILVERDSRLDLHPLARAFLEERREHRTAGSDPDVVTQCLAHYRARRDWDAAFDLIARRGPADALEQLMLDALDDLLEAARLPTLEAWCELAAELGLEAPAFSLARAELALRQGRLATSQALAESAAASEEGPEFTFRALLVAGRAAHLASREEEGLELFRRAGAAAATEADRCDALWGQLMCEIELVRPDAAKTLRQLTAGVQPAEPREVVRAAAHSLNFHIRSGSLDLADADQAHELLSEVADPLIESSFQSIYSNSLALAARYDEALAVATDFLANARRYRLDFAVPYALCSSAMAHSGLREWIRAAECLDEAVEAARSGRNSHAEESCFSVRLRALAQQGKHHAALALEVPSLRDSVLPSRTEVISSRALVLASIGRVEEATYLASEVRGLTHAIEPRVLVAAVDAIVALKRRSEDAVDRVAELVDTAFTAGAVDLLVAAYRSTPELLVVLLRAPSSREPILSLIRRVGDEDVASAVGYTMGSVDDPRERLTRREREVYELLRQGLSNRQIAELLFISESTAKLHAHHVYDKVGVRSRAALAVQAALERSDQATSATGSSDDAEAS